MQEILQTLKTVDQQHVIIVRKIKKLGFNSATALRQHFGRCGTVERIFVSHSHLHSRTRPASLGFVVMDSAESREAALAMGAEQVVRDITIYVGPFEQLERRYDQDDEEEQSVKEE